MISNTLASALLSYYYASRNMYYIGHEDTSVEKEREFETNYGAATSAVSELLKTETFDIIENQMMCDVAEELTRARAKFPSSTASLAALTEEVGEVAKALLDESSDRVYTEAVQVAVMHFV